MKFIGKLLLYILIALLVAIAGLYFLLQTRWGAEHISAWVSENSDYHLAFGAMDHRFSAPSHIVLENVTFGRDGQPATLVAKSVDIALSSRQLTEPRHVDTILLENGTLNLTDQTAPLPFKADRLQLRDMAFNSPNSEWKLSAQRVNGGVVPWSPEAGKVLGTKAQIQFSAGSLSLNDVPVHTGCIKPIGTDSTRQVEIYILHTKMVCLIVELTFELFLSQLAERRNCIRNITCSNGRLRWSHQVGTFQ